MIDIIQPPPQPPINPPRREFKQGSSIFKKPEALKDKKISPILHHKIDPDKSLFKDKTEISRLEFKSKMRNDPDVFKKLRQSGLTLSKAEKAEIEKIVLPQKTYGANISKKDLAVGAKKLYLQRFKTKDPVKREVIRKEVNFLKKLAK